VKTFIAKANCPVLAFGEEEPGETEKGTTRPGVGTWNPRKKATSLS